MFVSKWETGWTDKHILLKSIALILRPALCLLNGICLVCAQASRHATSNTGHLWADLLHTAHRATVWDLGGGEAGMPSRAYTLYLSWWETHVSCYNLRWTQYLTVYIFSMHSNQTVQKLESGLIWFKRCHARIVLWTCSDATLLNLQPRRNKVMQDYYICISCCLQLW